MTNLSDHEEITSITFDHEGAHLALTHRSQGYSANNRPDPLIIKSDTEPTEEAEEALELIKNTHKNSSSSGGGKTKTEGTKSQEKDSDDSSKEDVNKSKSTGDDMSDDDKVEITKADLDKLNDVASQLKELKKANELKDAELSELKKAAYEADLSNKVDLVKSLGFVSDEEDQVSLATALIKMSSLDKDSSEVILSALNKAKTAVSATDKEFGFDGEGDPVTHEELIKKNVRERIQKKKEEKSK